MKLWLDDVRKTPKGYISAKSVNEAKRLIEEAEKLAEITASVTHDHTEGIKSAKVIAAAIYLAKEGEPKDEITDYIIDNYYSELNIFSLDEIRKDYAWDETCQGSMPIAIKEFYEWSSFEDVIKTEISMGGDSDTIGAMVGSIAETYYGVDKKIISQVKQYLPREFIEVLDKIPTK